VAFDFFDFGADADGGDAIAIGEGYFIAGGDWLIVGVEDGKGWGGMAHDGEG
jgi:hypothetical protein